MLLQLDSLREELLSASDNARRQLTFLDKALILAVRKEYYWLIEPLVALGANPDAREYEWHRTPLHEELQRQAPKAGSSYITYPNVKTIQALLEAGADPTLYQGTGRDAKNALLTAASYKNNSSYPQTQDSTLYLEIILNACPDLTGAEARKNQHSALTWAAGCGCAQSVEVLLKRNNAKIINLPDGRGQTALMSAMKTGYIDVLESLISARPNVEARDQKGRTALMYAKHHPEAIRFLLSIGNADVYATDNDGKNALQLVRETSFYDPQIIPVLEKWMRMHSPSRHRQQSTLALTQ